MKNTILNYLSAYKNIDESLQLPGKVYLVGDDIIALPRDDGDCRYPYGSDGFNYWTYASGYIHCNEGLFSPFLRSSEGSEPKISFFVGTKDENKVVNRHSILSVPILSEEPENLLRITVFTKEATYYISETDALISAVRTFVKGRDIFFSLYILNKEEHEQKIYSSSYFNPFLKNSLMENSTDRWFRQMDYVPNENLGYFNLETYEEKDRGLMSTNYGLLTCFTKQLDAVLNYSATTSRYKFVGGSRSSLHSSTAVNQGQIKSELQHTCFTETGICGDVVDILLKDDFTINYVFTYADSEIDIKESMAIQEQDNQQSSYVDKQFEQLKETENESPLELVYEETKNKDVIHEDVMNPFMTHLKKQVEFCSEIKGYIQLSSFSLIGIRDVFQAIEGYLFEQPEKAKLKMLEALNFTSPTGRLPRQYSLPKNEKDVPAMDLRPFIDQGVWVISTIITYLRYTKDFDFLFETCGYYDIVDEHKHIVKKSALEDSVLDHMIKIMNYLLVNRDIKQTKCVLALYGDWNDALDGLGKSIDPSKEYGSGVSVMATLQVYQNLNEMIELLDYLVENNEMHNKHIRDEKQILIEKNRLKALVNGYKDAKEEIKLGLFEHAIDEDRIVHGWGDKKSYMVGSLNDPDKVSRDGITSNAFWILSGLIKEDDVTIRKNMILNAFKRLDSKYGMKTFEPYFTKGTKGVGRIPNLPRGTAENGATYIHASMFGVMSLFAIGESKLAWKELLKLMPVTHETISVSPYVVPNSYGLNEELNIDGESMQDWQTGSSNVLLKTIIKYVVGFEPRMNGFYIQPSENQPFKRIQMTIPYLNKKLKITYLEKEQINHHIINKHMEKNTNKSRIYTINGNEYEGEFDPLMNMNKLFVPDSMMNELAPIVEIVIKDYI